MIKNYLDKPFTIKIRVRGVHHRIKQVYLLYLAYTKPSLATAAKIKPLSGAMPKVPNYLDLYVTIKSYMNQ